MTSYNGDLNVSMQTGLVGSESDSKQALADIEAFMETMSFEGQTLTSEFAAEEKTNALLAMQLSRGSQQVHCEAEEGSAALYQWMVKVGQYTIMTEHFICHTGVNAREYPLCPQSACLDEQCQICEEGYWTQ